MKSHTEYLTFNVSERMGFVNITRQVAEAVERSGIQEGLVLCNAMHITASVFINDNEPGLHEDYKAWLEKLAPYDPSPKPIGTIRLARTMPTPTTSVRSWGARSSSPSPRAGSTSAPGNRFSMASSMAAGRSGCSSR